MTDTTKQKAVAVVVPAKIPGSPSLDDQFSGGRNPYSKSVGQIAAEHQQQQQQQQPIRKLQRG